MTDKTEDKAPKKTVYVATTTLWDTQKKVKIEPGEEVKGFSKERIEKLLDKKAVKKA